MRYKGSIQGLDTTLDITLDITLAITLAKSSRDTASPSGKIKTGGLMREAIGISYVLLCSREERQTHNA